MKYILKLGILITLLYGSTVAQYPINYDNFGNRISRNELVMKSSFPHTEKTGEYKIVVYPNPTKGNLSLDIGGLEDDKQVKVVLMDITGQVIYSNDNYQNGINIDLTNKSSGVYLLNIIIDNEVKSYWKIIKEE